MKMLKYIMTGLFVFATLLSFAQVTGVEFQLKYNEDNCNYDCYLIVTSGSATTALHRTNIGMQLTVVVPTGREVSIAENHYPLTDNLVSGTGTTPAIWENTSSVTSPSSSPNYDFHAFMPFLSPIGRYDDMQVGDTIKMVSITITDPVHGPNGVRLFINDQDPSSTAPGMNGGAFSNGQRLGSSVDIYQGNAEEVYPTSYADVIGQYTILVGQQVTLSSSTSGTWTNQDPSTVSLAGNTVSAIAPGIAEISFSPSTGCEEVVVVEVIPEPTGTPVNTIIGSDTGDRSALLDIQSTSQGLKLPVVPFGQLSSYASPQQGTLIYVPDGKAGKGVYMFQQSGWQLMPHESYFSLSAPTDDNKSIQVLTSDLEALEAKLKERQMMIDQLKDK